jgi:AraC-like DNA-binding protein
MLDDNLIKSFLFLFTGIIGLVTLSLLIKSYKSNPFCNFYLVLIISILSFRHLIHGTYHLGIQSVLKSDKGLFSILYLIIAPCIYLYYRHLIFPEKKYNFKDLKHLSFIVFLFLINSIEALDNSFIFYFGAMTNFLFILVFILFYLITIFNLLRKEIWFKKDLLLNSKHFKLVKNWTLYLFILNILCSIVLLISVYSELNKGVAPSGKSMATFLLFFWLFMFFKILTSPEILFGLPILNRTLLKFNDSLPEKNEESSVSSSNWILNTVATKSNQDLRLQENIRTNIESYIKEVEKLSTEELIFQKPKISQSDIAENLGVPTSHIVYLFKYHSKISFSEYRMNSRIQNAILLIKDGFLNTETLESLAYKTGFASYNPFFIAFKKITKLSPQEYLKSDRF